MTVILFDLEGTIVRSDWEKERYVKEFRRKIKKKMMDLGIPQGILEGIEKSTIVRNKAMEYVQANFPPQRAKQFHLEIEEFLGKYELKAARNSELCPETIPTLNRLKAVGYKLGLVTNTSKEALKLIFEKHELRGYFDTVVTREDVNRLKPSPEGVLLAIKKLRDGDFLLVGNQNHDALAAKSAGGISIIVKRAEARTHTETERSLGDYQVGSLSEIISLITRVNQSG